MHNDCPWNIRQLHVHYKNFFGPPWSLKRDYEWFLLTQKRDLLAILQALITAFNNLLSQKNGSKNQTVKVNISLLQESIEFRQTALESMLQLVYSIIWELKTHEIIENTVIMQVGLGIICSVSLKTVFGYFWFIWRKKIVTEIARENAQ